MLRSAMMAGVIALGSVGIAQPADARVFVSFGFPGFGWGYPYYPYYPAYAYPPYPYYPPYGPYPAAYPAPPAAPAGPPGPAAQSPGPTVSAVDPATVREIQADLQRRGYDVGPADGRLGPKTRAAIREYEQQNGLPMDGMPSPALRDHLHSHPAG